MRGINVRQGVSPWVLGYQNILIWFLFHDTL